MICFAQPGLVPGIEQNFSLLLPGLLAQFHQKGAVIPFLQGQKPLESQVIGFFNLLPPGGQLPLLVFQKGGALAAAEQFLRPRLGVFFQAFLLGLCLLGGLFPDAGGLLAGFFQNLLRLGLGLIYNAARNVFDAFHGVYPIRPPCCPRRR